MLAHAALRIISGKSLSICVEVTLLFSPVCLHTTASLDAKCAVLPGAQQADAIMSWYKIGLLELLRVCSLVWASLSLFFFLFFADLSPFCVTERIFLRNHWHSYNSDISCQQEEVYKFTRHSRVAGEFVYLKEAIHWSCRPKCNVVKKFKGKEVF